MTLIHKENCATNRICPNDHKGISCWDAAHLSCDCGALEVKKELDNEVRIKHKGVSHYACGERLAKFGGKTIGCCCNGHSCLDERTWKVYESINSKPQPKEWKKELDEILKHACGITEEDVKDLFYKALSRQKKEILENVKKLTKEYLDMSSDDIQDLETQDNRECMRIVRVNFTNGFLEKIIKEEIK